jgi:hypothetical protein
VQVRAPTVIIHKLERLVCQNIVLAALAKSSVFFKTISKILDFFSVFTFYTFEFFYKLKKNSQIFFYFLNWKGKSFKIQ